MEAVEPTTIRTLAPGDETALEAFLLPRIESSMFLLGNLRTSGLVDRGEPYTGTYAAAFDGERIVAVAAHFWNENLILQAPRALDRVWPAAVSASGRPVGGLVGPADQVARVQDALPVRAHNVQMDESEILYRLALADLQVPRALAEGRVRGRRASPGDLERLTAWRVAYACETLGATESLPLWQRSRQSVAEAIDTGRIWLLEAQGRPVACSGFNTVTAEAVQVGGVWTPPELRRQGYARAVVAASLLDAAAAGAQTAILFTGVTNIGAQTAYTALGFEPVGDYRLVRFRRALPWRPR